MGEGSTMKELADRGLLKEIMDKLDLMMKIMVQQKRGEAEVQEFNLIKDLLNKLAELVASSREREEEGDVFPAKVLKDGRITIPVEWRELRNIKEGDIVKIKILAIHRKEKNVSEEED